MAKRLNKVINEMRSYDKMGQQSGCSCGGAGKSSKVSNAYRLNDLLRNATRAEEEEDNIGMDRGDDMDMDMGADDGMEIDNDEGVESLKQFFQENPEPSNDEISAYADENGMDMDELRLVVYRLIASLLNTEEPMDDESTMDMDVDMGSDDAEMGSAERF